MLALKGILSSLSLLKGYGVEVHPVAGLAGVLNEWGCLGVSSFTLRFQSGHFTSLGEGVSHEVIGEKNNRQ